CAPPTAASTPPSNSTTSPGGACSRASTTSASPSATKTRSNGTRPGASPGSPPRPEPELGGLELLGQIPRPRERALELARGGLGERPRLDEDDVGGGQANRLLDAAGHG